MDTVWLYAIDWGDTAASLSAFAAVGVALWSAWWSTDTRRRERLARRAEARFTWIEKFRADLSIMMGNMSVAGSHYVITGTAIKFTDAEKAQQLALFHRLLMDLPVDRHHFTELRKAIYAVFADHADTASLNKAIGNLEFVATAAFATERKVALNELIGKAQGG